MPIIVIRNQAELDSLPAKFETYTTIEIRAAENTTIRVTEAWGQSHVVAREQSHVVAREQSHVEAWGQSHVEAWGQSHVVARKQSHVEAWGQSHVEAREKSHVEAREQSHVEAWGQSHVVAREQSHVEAWGQSHVVAWEQSHVEAWEQSHVVAWGQSHVVARKQSHVVAREQSHVVAWGQSHVEAWEQSHVEAWEQSCSRLLSSSSTIELYGCSCCFKTSEGTLKQHSAKATVITPEQPEQWKGVLGWMDENAITEQDGFVTLYKRVSAEYKTQEGQPWETTWLPGTTVIHPAYNPTSDECGGGKFHACSRPYFCDEFRSKLADLYVALRIKVQDMHAWDEDPRYPHKVGFREALVLHRVDRYGSRVD